MIHESCSFPIHMYAADTDALSGAGILKGNKTRCFLLTCLEVEQNAFGQG